MNELAKTGVFLAAAVVAVGLGVYTHLGPSEAEEGVRLAGQPMFAEFSPDAVKALEIDEYDAETARPHRFRVAQKDGVWVIPSKEDYPADAQQQLGEAAASILAAKTINIESDDRSSHALYGVVDPDPKTLEAGATGVGKHVLMEDKSGKKLVQLIVGKEVKGKPDLHYVRIPGQDRVYVVSLKTDKLSTKFEDWIEKDLLKLNAWDIERVAFKDYSLRETLTEMGLRVGIDPRSKIQISYDDKDTKWKLDELEVFSSDSDQFQPQELAEDEELNTQKLNELKTALDDLKIVDVYRKPEGLAADLRSGETPVSDEAQQSLVRRGFRFAHMGEGPAELFSNEGEIRCGTKEGVEYALRFGRTASAGEKEAENDDKESPAEEGETSDKAKEIGANRFVMVTVEFNEDLLTKPELEELPELKDEADKAAPAGKDEAQEEVKETSAIESTLADAEGQLALADEQDEGAGDKTEKPADKKPAKPAKDTAATKGPKSDKEKSDAKKPNVAKPKTQAQLARERVEKENERKQKDYDDKVKKGKEKVKELSDRFADWYYVVSDSTYQKIHLGRDEIVKQKTPSADDKKKDEHDHEEEGKGTLLKDDDKKLPD